MPWCGGPSRRSLGAVTTAHITTLETGREMMVGSGFNGDSYFNDGGRYNAAGDSWTVVGAAGVPAARSGHTAVWTGSEMIVWGGVNSVSRLNDGGRYSPAGNSWTAVSTTGAPGARDSHT